ncbi:hypothetical protein NP233_g4469 [Leucocoprinus birnbaumii]|uniref:Uncharacterized protein n=1 Tax=Leucocoprinus birnbaumii TaxID=56174 RepID=A0AAD5VUY7_9AGAR|nr:hypothetical protein NP233_g4469 [Leucocoprinus birnbaumii]
MTNRQRGVHVHVTKASLSPILSWCHLSQWQKQDCPERRFPQDNVNTIQPVSHTSSTEVQARAAMATNEDNIDPRLRGLQADGTRVATPSPAPDEGAADPSTTALPDADTSHTTQDSAPPQSTVAPTRSIGENDGSSEWEDDDDDDFKGAKGNAPHGFIEGVMCSNHEFRWSFHTCRAAQGLFKSSTHASKRFARVIRQILTRIENLAVETGCWIYLAAQHATAVTPFIHYASPSLQTKAGPKLDIIHTNFSIIMKTLVTSRRREAMELMLELEEQKEKLELAQKEAEVARKDAESHRRDRKEGCCHCGTHDTTRSWSIT